MPLSREITGPNRDDRKLLSLLALGLTEANASRVMGRSLGAIHIRATRLREYSGTHNQAQLVYWALDNTLIPPLPAIGGLSLTNRQLEVTELIAQGLSDGEIATKLYLTPSSVITHVVKAMNRLRAFNRSNLVAVAWSEDLFV